MKPRIDKYSCLILIGSLFLIIVIGFAVYINSLYGEFIWDDHHLILNNPYIKDISCISDIFSKDIGAAVGKTYNSYRPLQMLTYMLDYYLYKFDVRGYHLTSIFFHILAGLCISWFIHLLFRNPLLAVFTSILFVVHPIHTEAVAYISGRADSLSLLFMLLCFICYIKYRDLGKNIFYILLISTYMAALLSRENSLVFPLLVLLYHYIFKVKINKKGILSIVIITFSYIILRLTFLRSFTLNLNTTTTILQRIPGFFVAITNYVRLMLLPFDLHMEYSDIIFSPANPKAIIGVLILVGSLYFAFKKRDSNRLVSFSILWFFIALLPQSNIYPIEAYMAEHWLYVPSIGFFLILANGLGSLYNTRGLKTVAIIFAISVMAFYSLLTIKQNTFWRESLLFYKRTLLYAPESARVHYNLGNTYLYAGRHKEAIASYKRALEIDPDYADVYNNLGLAYNSIGRYDEAISSYKKAIGINPDHAATYNNFGVAYQGSGRHEDALLLFKKAIEINPNFAGAYYNLGNSYEALDKREEAILSYKKAIEINPTYASAYNNLGSAYYNLGKKEESIGYYMRAVELNPDYVSAYNNLGMVYYKIGRYSEAAKYYKKVTKLKPDHAITYFNLAVVQYYLQDYNQAVMNCDKAIELGHEVNPEFLRLLEPYRKEEIK